MQSLNINALTLNEWVKGLIIDVISFYLFVQGVDKRHRLCQSEMVLKLKSGVCVAIINFNGGVCPYYIRGPYYHHGDLWTPSS